MPYNYKHFTNTAIATGLGTGYSPIAPGTVGSLLACIIYWLIWFFSPHWFAETSTVGLWLPLVMALATFVLGVPTSGYMEQKLAGKDPGCVVIDEIAGLWLTLSFVSFSPPRLLAAFLLFRFFDILKPYPINIIDKKVHGGMGIMLDDMLAGVYACICLHLVVYWGLA